jgi:hypothetical protein
VKCSAGCSIPRDKREQGKGGLELCPECARQDATFRGGALLAAFRVVFGLMVLVGLFLAVASAPIPGTVAVVGGANGLMLAEIWDVLNRRLGEGV